MSRDLALRTIGGVQPGFSEDQVQILRNSLFKDFDDEEIKFCLAVCQRTGLDPFVRQIHFKKHKRRNSNEKSLVIVTGIDGFRLTANRSAAYAGSDEPVFETAQGKKWPTKASVTVYKMVQGSRCPFTASARWDEYYPGDGDDGFMWRKMPHGQLAKCAEALALRKAFPQELSGLYTHEEMAQASRETGVVTTKAQDIMAKLNEAPGDLEIESVPAEPAAAEPTSAAAPAAPAQSALGDFVIEIGKRYEGRMLKDMDKDDLASYVKWVKKNIRNKNTATLDFLKNAEAFLEEA